MGQPDWESFNTNWDVLVVLNLATNYHTTDAIHRFSLRGTRTKTTSNTWGSIALGGVYYGLLTKISPLRQGFGTDLKPKIVYPTMTMTIALDDSAEAASLVSDIKSYSFIGDCGIFLVKPGTQPSETTDMVFWGKTNPGSYRIYRDRVEITVSDRTKDDDTDLPGLTVQEYAGNIGVNVDDCDPEWLTRKMPILWGDWDNSKDYYQIEVPCVMTNNLAGNLQFILAQAMDPTAGVDQFGQIGTSTRAVRVIFPDGTREEFSVSNEDLETGYFEAAFSSVVDTATKWEAGTKCYVMNPKGNLNSIQTLIDNPVEIWYHTLTTYGSVSTSAINVADYITLKGTFATIPYRARRWIHEETKISELVQELCYEFGFFSYVSKNVYRCTQNSFYQNLIATKTWRACNFKRGTLRVEVDPSDWQSDRFTLDYSYHPQSDKYVSSVAAGDGDSWKTIKSKWIGNDDTANTRVSLIWLAFSNPALALRGSVVKDAMDDDLTSAVRAIFDDVDDTFQVFELTKNLDTGIAEITGFALSWYFSTGAWTSDTAASYTSETDENNRRQNGYWTDDAGLCDPSDSTSSDSHWTT
jgi:hypothetical protein